MTILGGSAARFNGVEIIKNDKSITVVTNVSLHQVHVSGWFKSDLLVSEFLFVAEGKFNVIIDGLKAKFNLNGSLNQKNMLTIQSLEMFPDVKSMNFNITGVSKDDGLSKLTN